MQWGHSAFEIISSILNIVVIYVVAHYSITNVKIKFKTNRLKQPILLTFLFKMYLTF